MKSILFILQFVFVCTAFPQMIKDVAAGYSDGFSPVFNVEFIRDQRIKNMTGHFSTKAELDYIRPSDEVVFYKFNRAGELIYETLSKAGDTLVTVYIYDERGNLLTERKSDRYVFQVWHYRYDSMDRVIYKEFRREANKGQNRMTHQPGEETIVTSERYDYIPLEQNNYKKLYYNDAGLVYMEEFFYFNEHNQLTKQEGALKNGSGRITTTYAYNEKRQLVEKISENTIMGTQTAKEIFEYDEAGNILASRYYKNGEYITEYQLIFYPDSDQLKAVITRDHATNFMTIVTFRDYGYFD